MSNNSQKTNLKTVILSAILAPLTALETKLNSVLSSVNKRADVQDDSIQGLQTNIAANHATIATALTDLVTLQKEVRELSETHYTAKQLEDIIQRNRELEWICQQLHSIVYDLKTTGSTIKDMPDFEHPIVTRAELEQEFRLRYEIPDGNLTEEQQEQFEHFIVQWFIDNPGHVLDENLN